MDRRQFLFSSALGAAILPMRRAFARSQTGPTRKFLFVVNYGGWDPTRVFAPEFQNLNVDMERSAQVGTVGDLRFVDHADRPSVRTFFERYAERTTLFNGILVPSVAHENCLRLIMTGSTRQDASDWGAITAGAAADGFALPQVVAAGPSFPGDFGAYVTRTGTSGQLPALLDGSILGWSDQATRGPSTRSEAVMDAYLRTRVNGYAGGAKGRAAELAAAMRGAVDRTETLKGLGSVVNWSASSAFSEQLDFATDVFSLGVSRVVTTQFYYNSWDTHINNDTDQSANFEMLYSSLLDLFDKLRGLPGEVEASLLDETVVVVLSEMGRTPKLNSGAGKDHWPYTCAMVVGPGLVGGRTIGGYDSYYYGLPVDMASGEVDEANGETMSSDVFGATLLRAAGIDSEAELPGVAVVEGALTE